MWPLCPVRSVFDRSTLTNAPGREAESRLSEAINKRGEAENGSVFFYTDIDPRAAIKGSRDPLGLQPIWTRFGRSVVGNLTTVTTSARNFTTLIVGLYFAERMIQERGHSERDRAALFLKFEQLAGYSREAGLGGGSKQSVLGITRIRRRLSEGDELRISAERRHQILSNQKAYGLWGLYTVAARQSGFCEPGTRRLTLEVRDFVEGFCLKKLARAYSRAEDTIIGFLERDRDFEPNRRHRALRDALAALHGPEFESTERDFFMKSLVEASRAGFDPTKGLQAALWRSIESTNDATRGWGVGFDYDELLSVLGEARRNSDDELSRALERICVLEPLLVACSCLFAFCLDRNEAPIERVASEIRRTWGDGLTHISPDAIAGLKAIIAAAGGEETADRFSGLAACLNAGRYASAIGLAIEQNAAVMNARGGAPWLAVKNGRLDVRLRAERGGLPPLNELPRIWASSYFLNSLKSVGAAVAGKVAA